VKTAYEEDYQGNRKKILILGAGNAQIDLIRYCKRMGMEVLGCSYSDTDPGIPLLDHFEQINITDVRGVIAYAEREAVDFIYSV
jgi:formate-dependent phosphoribosylglycinamide formyltransferase (GAR transformylase)